jgi:hypothetical protein
MRVTPQKLWKSTKVMALSMGVCFVLWETVPPQSDLRRWMRGERGDEERKERESGTHAHMERMRDLALDSRRRV